MILCISKFKTSKFSLNSTLSDGIFQEEKLLRCKTRNLSSYFAVAMKRTACCISVFSVFHRSPKCKSSLIRRYKLYTKKGRKWIIRKPVTYFATTTFDSWKYLIISGLLQWLLRQHETTLHFIIYSYSILKQAENISFYPPSCCDYVACAFYDKRNQISFHFYRLCIIDFRKLNRCQPYHVFHNTYEITGLNSLSEFSNFRENRRP